MIQVSRPKAFLMKLVDLVLPPRCVLTGEIVAAQGTLAPEGWQSLRFISPPFCQTCSYPFDFETENMTQCGVCLIDPPPFASARAVLAYDDASRDLILKFKHGDHLQAVPALVPMLARAGADSLGMADLIVPVPLHRWRLLRRRYNQAALLAWGLARRMGKPCLPDALIRTRATPSQGHGANDRTVNVRGAFGIHPKHGVTVAGQRILLVDDVFTTGATLRECAKVLLEADAKEVHVLTIARVVRAGSL
ncbi:MAG TPA: ComF family protein [Micavibrio sp.]|jgi:ComF family protein